MVEPAVPGLWLPIVLSGLALGVSLAAFLWQVIKHFRFDGGRVLVKLRPAMWDPGISLGTMGSADGSWRAENEPRDRDRRRAVECAELVVENAGGQSVTISAPGVHYRGVRPSPLRRRQRRSVSPRLFDVGSCGVQTKPTGAPLRLAPYDRVTFVLDIHSVIGMARAVHPKSRRVVLRGYVDVAGHRHPSLSTWRRRWRVPSEARTLVGYGDKVPVEAAIVLILARDAAGSGDPSSLEYASRLIAAGLWAERAFEDDPLQRVSRAFEYGGETLDDCFETAGRAMLKFNIGQLLQEEAEHLTWAGAELQLSLHEQAIASHEPAESQGRVLSVDAAEVAGHS